MTRAENMIADVALDAMKVVRDRRDAAQNAMRNLSAVLADMRVAARALAAIDTTDNGWPAEAGKLDDEVQAIVKELAGLFVDETVKADDVEVKEDGPRVLSEWFTSRYGVAVAYVEPMSDRGPHVMVDGIVLDPSVVAAVIEHHAYQERKADDLTLKVLSGAYSAELLIDEAAKKIVQRLRGSGGPGATFSEPMVAWLNRLESRVRFYFTEQEKSL